MSSLKQIEANRRNALKSTGPTTPEGKERSRRNALRHGLTAETVIAALEDAEDYQAFEAAVTADYDAETAVERELVLRLASVLWRLRRATGIETALFESVIAEPGKLENGCPRLTLVGGVNLPEQNQLGARAARQSDAAAANEPRSQSKKEYRRLLLALGRTADIRPRSPQPLRTPAVAASPSDCVHPRIVKAAQAAAAPVKLSVFVSAGQVRRLAVGPVERSWAGCRQSGNVRSLAIVPTPGERLPTRKFHGFCAKTCDHGASKLSIAIGRMVGINQPPQRKERPEGRSS